MKVEWNKIVATILAIAMGIILFIGMSSCRTAEWHLGKFKEKGGKIECKSDTLWKYDTTIVDGETVIDSFPIPCNCPEVVTPEPRWRTKWMDRVERRRWADSVSLLNRRMKHRESFIIDSMIQARKIMNVERKSEKTKAKKSTGNGIVSLIKLALVIAGLFLLMWVLSVIPVRKRDE